MCKKLVKISNCVMQMCDRTHSQFTSEESEASIFSIGGT